MPDSITIPQHDRRPYPRVELVDGDGVPVGLEVTDTAFWLMRPISDLTSVLRVAATIVDYGVPGTRAAVVEWQIASSGAPTGWASPGNHPTGKVAVFDQEVEVQDSAGLPMTFPTDLPNTVTIRDDIDYP